ncbi:MipA/OmpV family protein [Klebsiella pneumoniae]
MSFSSQAASENTTSSVTVGLGAQYAPEYTGADKYNTNVLPYIEWSNDTWFLNSEKGAGYNWQFDNGIYIGQALGYSVGRTDKGNSWIQEGSNKLKGMGKIKPALTSTTTAGWWVTPWVGFEGNIIAPLTDSQGMQYNVKINLVLFSNDTDTLTVSSEGKYGDARFNNTWFGVNERQSTNSGYSKYNAGSGINSIDYTINWQHAFTDTWSGYADFRYTTLSNRVNRSPIVKKDDYITFTIGALYTF